MAKRPAKGPTVQYPAQNWRVATVASLCSHRSGIGPSGRNIWLYYGGTAGRPYVTHYMNWGGYPGDARALLAKGVTHWCDDTPPHPPTFSGDTDA